MKRTGLFSVWEIMFWWVLAILAVMGLLIFAIKTSLNSKRCFMDKDITAYMYLDNSKTKKADLNVLVNQYMAGGWRPLQGAIQDDNSVSQTLVQYTYTQRCFKIFKQSDT